mmetsp:Transcript_20948/g.58916  ORF Transcript_20948/g.58916 Transcript_20948/m.58916 type:complete len:313 (+) Transcript_20948:129-1067(+)|eukprot:CAMPEP_0119155580 /NCGR_PEP_ID=MMETSP1310-20130426/51821_1 /TAXON_ID=464262 /ORGANISM="Genus nov. species nov., Strain RCC2339" /LENGTH=312 /DNA_ID=CAMNT_0007148179 /DNA_START=121 /DNA_END=1059 /DNA_ORIENTATION=+
MTVFLGLSIQPLAVILVCIIMFVLFLAATGRFDRYRSRPTAKPSPTESSSKSTEELDKWGNKFRRFQDIYESIGDVQKALREAGLESSSLILAIDYTKSNDYTGDQTFNGLPLHNIDPNVLNPYQQVISIIGRTLEEFDDDKRVPVFGFGDATTTNKGAFPFFPDRVCYTVSQVLQRYDEITPVVKFSGPTNFAPVIYKAIDIVRTQSELSLHILVIIADGQVTDEVDTMDAIVEASHYPICIIMVGVGDGPWDMMKEFDDELPERVFDNFQFVDYNEIMSTGKYGDASFALHALQEIPQQYKALQEFGMLA